MSATQQTAPKADDAQKTIRHPKAWKYLLFAVAALIVLLPAWFIFDVWVLTPELQSRQETAMDISRWISVPLVVVTLVFGGHWLSATYKAQASEREWKQKTELLKKQEAQAHSEKAQREYVLEVIGLGVTLDKYRQGKLWDALQKDNAYTSIREQDPKKYAWTAFDKVGVGGGRVCDAFENGAERTPMFWGGPSFYAGSPIEDPNKQPGPSSPVMGVAGSIQSTGMAWHLFVNGGFQLDERPDRILEKVFAFFDANPDVPYIVLSSDDSMGQRNQGRVAGTPMLVKDGYYIPEMPDSAAVFVLARRERVEPLRPYVWDDPDNNFVQEKLRNVYFALMKIVPTVEINAQFKTHLPRAPTVAEWLPVAAAFAKDRGTHATGMETIINFKPWTNYPPEGWKPTPWFPIPWNREQMETFDRLPSLGFIHRPTFVKFVDEHGQPVKRRSQRQQILEAGWHLALQSLPEAERAKGPARIIAASANKLDQQLALDRTLFNYEEQGGPEFDTNKLSEFINTDRRLGNTGAATFFVQMALGVMGSYRDGGTSAAINLRDPNEASIIFISPPSDEKRKEQGEPFGNHVTPAIDPANYKNP